MNAFNVADEILRSHKGILGSHEIRILSWPKQYFMECALRDLNIAHHELPMNFFKTQKIIGNMVAGGFIYETASPLPKRNAVTENLKVLEMVPNAKWK